MRRAFGGKFSVRKRNFFPFFSDLIVYFSSFNYPSPFTPLLTILIPDVIYPSLFPFFLSHYSLFIFSLPSSPSHYSPPLPSSSHPLSFPLSLFLIRGEGYRGTSGRRDKHTMSSRTPDAKSKKTPLEHMDAKINSLAWDVIGRERLRTLWK